MLSETRKFDQSADARGTRSPQLLRLSGVVGVLPDRDLPGATVTNADIARLMPEVVRALGERGISRDIPLSSVAFPEERMGVLERKVLDRELGVCDLAILAARRVLAQSPVALDEIGMVIVSTVSAGSVVPAVATAVCAALDLPNCTLAFDLCLGCNGFMAALAVAQGNLAAGTAGKAALVIGADAMSRVLDASDRGSLPIFGDGAGAVLLTKAASEGCLPVETHTFGAGGRRIQIRPSGAAEPLFRLSSRAGVAFIREELETRQRVALEGQRVFRDMVRTLPNQIRSYLKRHGIPLESVDKFAFHQANARLVGAIASALGLDPGRVLSNIAKVGNTTSASIPLLLDDAARLGQLQAGERVLLVGFGAGYSLGMVLIQW